MANGIWHAASPAGQDDSREAQVQKEFITQFILALSDEQLVTGLAVLIAGVANQLRLSSYEFGMILSLA